MPRKVNRPTPPTSDEEEYSVEESIELDIESEHRPGPDEVCGSKIEAEESELRVNNIQKMMKGRERMIKKGRGNMIKKGMG